MIAPVTDWAVVAGISTAALLSGTNAFDSFYQELSAGALVAGLAALALRYFVSSLLKLNSKRMTAAAPSSRVH